MICSFATYANVVIEGSVYPVHVCHGAAAAAAAGTPIPIVKVASAPASRATEATDLRTAAARRDICRISIAPASLPCPQRPSPPGHSKSKSYVSRLS